MKASRETVEQLNATCSKYVVPIVVDNVFRGSATLVELNARFFVLTAAHVIQSGGRNDFDFSSSRQIFQLVITEDIHQFGIPMSHLTLSYCSKRETDHYGPDLGAIELPDSWFLEQIKALKSFFNLDRMSSLEVEKVLASQGAAVMLGFPESLHAFEQTRVGPVGSLGGRLLWSNETHRFQEDPFDFWELRIEMANHPGLLPDLRGVSGSGIWWVQAGATKNLTLPEDVILCGVAFYQSDLVDGVHIVRGHGPNSLYSMLKQILQRS